MTYDEFTKIPGVRSVIMQTSCDTVPMLDVKMDCSTLDHIQKVDDRINDSPLNLVIPNAVSSGITYAWKPDDDHAFPMLRSNRPFGDCSGMAVVTRPDNTELCIRNKPYTLNGVAKEMHGLRLKFDAASITDAIKNYFKEDNKLIRQVADCPSKANTAFLAVTDEKAFNSYASCIKVDKIIYNNPATIVFWDDGSKTIVKRVKGTPFNKYNAFCAAVCKKLYGSNSALNRIVNSGIDQTKKKKKAGKKKNG